MVIGAYLPVIPRGYDGKIGPAVITATPEYCREIGSTDSAVRICATKINQDVVGAGVKNAHDEYVHDSYPTKHIQ